MAGSDSEKEFALHFQILIYESILRVDRCVVNSRWREERSASPARNPMCRNPARTIDFVRIAVASAQFSTDRASESPGETGKLGSNPQNASSPAPTPELGSNPENVSAPAQTPELGSNPENVSAPAQTPELGSNPENVSAPAQTPELGSNPENVSAPALTPELGSNPQNVSAPAQTPELGSNPENVSAPAQTSELGSNPENASAVRPSAIIQQIVTMPERGAKLGPYEILDPIGAGGMGEVWKARDTRLDRIVALKISKEQFSERFDREARAVAALNHPRICQLYDVGPNYLVMEFIDGAPLKGPLAIDKAVEYAGQILDALDAAHRKSITHRDLKPPNILVTKQGIKLLDFGLAKQAAPLEANDATVTQALTQQGQIVGTLQYMSPEQLQGKEADARSDVFAFGCVLYEMLTGKRAFEAGNAASIIGAILERPAPSLADVAPAALDRVMRLCLAKDPDDRWQSARDVRHALQFAAIASPAPSAKTRRRWLWPAIAALAFSIAAFAWVTAASRQPDGETRAVHIHVNPPPGTHFLVGTGPGAISPDGRAIAFVAVSVGNPRLWVRPLDSLTARELSGTESAQLPFWSPDSRSLAFFAGGKLKRMDLSGGPPAVIADAPNPRGGTWNPEGSIVFAALSPGGGLQVVPASGGTPARLINNESGVELRWPQFLPDGRRFLYSIATGKTGTGIYHTSLDRPAEKTRLTINSSAFAYAPPRGNYPGYLVWVSGNTLMAQPFDANRAQLFGTAAPVPGAEWAGGLGFAVYPPFSVSRDGKLMVAAESDRYQLTWFNREGKVLSTVMQPDRYAAIRISPDGSRAAVALGDSSGHRDIWQLQFARGVQSRITTNGGGFVVVWSPDGQRLAYHRLSTGELLERDANAAGQEETVLRSKRAIYINDWSPDGRYLLYTETSAETQYDLWLLPTSGDRTPVPFLRTAFNESHGQFSPDGRWIAYTSDESGQPEIFVQSRDAGGFKAAVSNGGGSFARWRKDGKELFYRALDGNLMATPVKVGTHGLEFGTPTALFRTVDPLGTFAYTYDVAADGQSILALAPEGGGSNAPPLILLVNWEAGLKK
jgi:eukaryotic-like serine/threonine-protein kinase